MIQCLNPIHATITAQSCSFGEFLSKSLFPILPTSSSSFVGNGVEFRRQRGTPCYLPVLINNAEGSCFKAKGTDTEVGFPDVNTLRRFPKEELFAKTVLVRFDLPILLRAELEKHTASLSSALSTVKYVYEAGSKVILVSSWSVKNNLKLLSVEEVAEQLSLLLQLKVMPTKCLSLCMKSEIKIPDSGSILLLENLSSIKADLANDTSFSRNLSSGIDIFINDCFSSAHKMLASTVGITRYCGISIAGFHFEERLLQLKKLVDRTKNSCVAIVWPYQSN